MPLPPDDPRARPSATLVASPKGSPSDADTVSGAPDAARPARRRFGPDRYEHLGVLGEGAMGEVRRVRDRWLGRTLAMKVVKPHVLSRPTLLSRFLEEAQATAQLQHPGIVPVHDAGEMPDGRLWFTMAEITGRTFDTVIAEVHEASPAQWQPAPSGWTLRRLVDAFRRMCEAVAYAHMRGVIHRDLKPTNLMVGELGEALVVDWGLAKVLQQPDLAVRSGIEPVRTERSATHAHATRLGAVAGTPLYMPPEQARGDIKHIDARSDVYALGAVLYEILSGRPPYPLEDAEEVLRKVLAGPPAPLLGRAAAATVPVGMVPLDAPPKTGPPPPPELVATCERAMARDPADRFANAAELALEVSAWLDGVRRADKGRTIVREASTRAPRARALRAEAAALRAEAAAMLVDIEPWRPEEDKFPAWDRQSQADARERQADLLQLEEEQLLHSSLSHAPDLPEAHAALAARYRAELAAAEALHQDNSRAEVLMRQHLAALPTGHPDRARHTAWLKGDGALTLLTDPPGAEVVLYRYVLHRRRLVAREVGSLGRTPLRAVSLPRGSYLCVLRHPTRAEVRYPVQIGRQEHWDGVPPGGSAPQPIHLPHPSALSPGDCYVPAGWFWSGDPKVPFSLPPRRLWVDNLILRRQPVTNAEYLGYLNDLVASGRLEEAMRTAPRERAPVGTEGRLIYGYRNQRFELTHDADGDIWDAAWPVIMVDWHAAASFAAWKAAQTGQPWRLPGELEWEKAGRGVDGRSYPWGDGFDPSWTCMRQSHRGRPLPSQVARYPIDESPYGVRDMAGNTADWCADAYQNTGPAVSAHNRALPPPSAHPDDAMLIRRGGSWDALEGRLRIANRNCDKASFKNFFLGIRTARSFP